jgi:hypothetical protein
VSGRRPGAFLLVPVICPARWSEVDGRIGGIATGATIAADADGLIECLLIAVADQERWFFQCELPMIFSSAGAPVWGGVEIRSIPVDTEADDCRSASIKSV